MHAVRPDVHPRARCPGRASAALVALALFVASGPARAGITDAVKARTLANGLKVLVLENHKAPVATFNVFYKVGSRDETGGKTGISHLLEHLMFRGTKKLKPEEFSAIIQRNGGMDNAFTTSDFTDYFEVINRDHLDVPISLEAERMANFAPKGFKSELQVVTEERRLRTEDDPGSALSELVRAQAFLEHPYHWPVIGWMRDIQNLTLADVHAYHQVYYSPQNALIVAVGDFDAAKVMKQIAESFGAIGNGPKPPRFFQVEPPQKGERRVELHHAANLPAFEHAWHVPNYKSPDSFALEIAAEILADGKSSRLYRRLVIEKRMVVYVGAGYDMTAFSPSLFTVSAQVRPGVKTRDVIAEVDKEIAALKDRLVSAEELEKAKNLERADFVFGQDSIFRQAMMIGIYEMLGDYRMLDQYLKEIDKVSARDVRRVVRKYLKRTNRTTGVLIPTGLLPHGGGRPASSHVRHAGDHGSGGPK